MNKIIQSNFKKRRRSRQAFILELITGILFLIPNNLFAQKNNPFTIEQVPINWTDYQEVQNLPEGNFDARTYMEFGANWKSTIGPHFIDLEINCHVIMDKSGSMVKYDVLHSDRKDNPEALLNHERGHWLIAMIQFKELTNFIKDFEFTTNYEDQIKQILKNNQDIYEQTQRKYDLETDHGLKEQEQTAWEKELIEQSVGLLGNPPDFQYEINFKKVIKR